MEMKRSSQKQPHHWTYQAVSVLEPSDVDSIYGIETWSKKDIRKLSTDQMKCL